MKDKLVGTEEECTITTLDTLGPRAVVSRRIEGSSTAPSTVMIDVEGKSVR